MTVSKRTPIKQPPFDARISRLEYPLQDKSLATIKRGFMVWHQPITGFAGRAQVDFLYNPSVVEATLSLSDASVGSILLFPNANDKADLRVPLQQTVSFSIMYDRTYELWDSYNPNGQPKYDIGPDLNNPRVVGVLADILQMEQFTGMTIGYSSGFSPTKVTSANVNRNSFAGHQGLVQLIPSYVYFGGPQSMSFYGYITEWDFQVTHWTKNMIPMRCIINVSWTMLPPPQNSTSPGPPGSVGWIPPGSPGPKPVNGATVVPLTSNAGRSGR